MPALVYERWRGSVCRLYDGSMKDRSSIKTATRSEPGRRRKETDFFQAAWLERGDALFQRRVRHEQALQATGAAFSVSMPKACIESGSGSGVPVTQAFQRTDHVFATGELARHRRRRGTRDSRENHMTIMLARMPSTSCAMIVVIMNAGPWPRSVLNTTRSTV